MSRKEDYINKIEDFSNESLPNININPEDQRRIKESVMKLIKNLKEKNLNDFKINITEEEAINIKNELGEDAEKRVLGVKNSKVMKGIVEKTIEKELEDETIIKKVEYKLPSIAFSGLSAIFNYAFVTDKEFIWYGFDINYKIVTKGRRKLSELKRVGRVREGLDEESGIEFYISGKNFYFPMIIRGSDSIADIDEMIEYLVSIGVKRFNKDKFAKYEKIFYIITYSIVALGLLKFITSVFL